MLLNTRKNFKDKGMNNKNVCAGFNNRPYSFKTHFHGDSLRSWQYCHNTKFNQP